MRTSIAFSVRVLWVCACLGLCLVTAAHDAELNAAHRDLMQNRPVCNGRLVRRTVLMEKTRNNRRIRYGDIVTNISYMKVRAFRAKESLVLASDNDAMATNFGTDGRVLIISQNNNQAKPVADPKGNYASCHISRSCFLTCLSLKDFKAAFLCLHLTIRRISFTASNCLV